MNDMSFREDRHITGNKASETIGSLVDMQAKRISRALKQRYRKSRLDTDRPAWITQARKNQQLFASK